MGKATRWLKGVLGLKKGKENMENNSNSGDKRDKKKWGFAKSGKDSGGLNQIPANIPAESAWLRSFIDDSDKNQNKHAIAVAAATAAAADAAVAAAQAAVAVVRLTSKGRGALYNGGREKWAAVKIQSFFRGYLARKALRALKGLVKLQAVVRGFLVRKRAAATLYSMQALIRAQASIRSQRARRLVTNEHRLQPETRGRKSIERFDETRSEFHSKRLSASYDYHSTNAFDESPKIVEIDTCCPKARPGYQVPARLSIPNRHNPQDCDWGYIEEDYKFPTAQSTPRFAFSGQGHAHAPTTPTKSVCGDSFFRPYSNGPNYMANTQSFRAKLRSLSAPKQRPETGPKRRLSLNEIMASRTSFSGVRMQRPSFQVQEDLAC